MLKEVKGTAAQAQYVLFDSWFSTPSAIVNIKYLHLSKEFQSRSYDAMTAHTTVVFVRYILLALENRENKDERSICDIFFCTMQGT
ncbi:MAG: hypothetical protein GX913_03345 [Clostridiales bacterium]|nr:hypothetical protein [Clostridiales bacterium]